MIAAGIWLIAIVLLLVVSRRRRGARTRGRIGAASAGTVYSAHLKR
jgi:hypothetical protein